MSGPSKWYPRRNLNMTVHKSIVLHVIVTLTTLSYWIGCVAQYLCVCCVDIVESLLVIASVGVQLTTTFASGRQTAMFYDIADISSIVINEAVTMVNNMLLSLHMEYGWDTKFPLCVFFGHDFLHQDFTDWHEIWHDALSVSQTDLLKFSG